jgi:hypothetical protein
MKKAWEEMKKAWEEMKKAWEEMKKAWEEMKKAWEEMKKVGFSDWYWFNFVIKRNEFHPSLELRNYTWKYRGFAKCIKDRDRAYRLGEELE